MFSSFSLSRFSLLLKKRKIGGEKEEGEETNNGLLMSLWVACKHVKNREKNYWLTHIALIFPAKFSYQAYPNLQTKLSSGCCFCNLSKDYILFLNRVLYCTHQAISAVLFTNKFIQQMTFGTSWHEGCGIVVSCYERWNVKHLLLCAPFSV